MHPIYYLETFIDPQRFHGACYRAANWSVLWETTGRGKDAPTRQANRSIKEVLGYPLVKDFRQRLIGAWSHDVGIAMPDAAALVRMSRPKVVELLYLYGMR